MAINGYSAGMVSKPFWYVEFKIVMRLLSEGKSFDEIKELSAEQNIFGVSKAYRAKEIYNCISRRAKHFDHDLIELFCNSDLATTKIIALISVIRTDKLFYEFLYEVYREKVLLGVRVLEESDIRIYLKNKQMQDTTVASWKDYTLKKLSNSYLNYLTDSGLLTNNNGKKEITPPILDVVLERYLIATKQSQIVKAITGANFID